MKKIKGERGKGKLVTISFRGASKAKIKVSTPGHHTRTGAQTGPNRVKAHSKHSKHLG